MYSAIINLLLMSLGLHLFFDNEKCINLIKKFDQIARVFMSILQSMKIINIYNMFICVFCFFKNIIKQNSSNERRNVIYKKTVSLKQMFGRDRKQIYPLHGTTVPWI